VAVRSVARQAGLEAGRGPEARPTDGAFIHLGWPQVPKHSLTVAALK